MQIVFAGSIAYDYLMTFPGHFREHFLDGKLESISLSFLVDGMTRHRGGVAPNIAYTYALLGGKGTILGAAGAEDFSDYKAALEGLGIDCSGIRLMPGMFTASFFANTDLSKNQIASFYPGAMSHARHCRIQDLPFTPDLVVISADDPVAMREHVRECKALGVPYLYDPSQQLVRMTPEELREGVEGAHMLALNEYEWHLVQENLKLSLDDVLGMGTILINTLGKQGVRVYADGEAYFVEAADAVNTDPTGAGDAFRGGFLRGYAAGLPWEVCAQMGNLSSAYCIEQVGTQNHRFTVAEFKARYAANYGDPAVLSPVVG